MDFRSTVKRGAAHLYHRAWLLRAVTLGVRGVVFDKRGVFLVRHTYVDGWYLPGGGVDRGESAQDALVRELREEGGVVCLDAPHLHGIFLNGTHDHVACYVVRRFEIRESEIKANGEIAETRFFPVDALPEAATPATRARLHEVLAARAASRRW